MQIFVVKRKMSFRVSFLYYNSNLFSGHEPRDVGGWECVVEDAADVGHVAHAVPGLEADDLGSVLGLN